MAVNVRAIVSRAFPWFTTLTVYVPVSVGSMSLSSTVRVTSGSLKGSTVRVAVIDIAMALFVVLRAVRVTTRGPGEVVHARTGVSCTTMFERAFDAMDAEDGKVTVTSEGPPDAMISKVSVASPVFLTGTDTEAAEPGMAEAASGALHTSTPGPATSRYAVIVAALGDTHQTPVLLFAPPFHFAFSVEEPSWKS